MKMAAPTNIAALIDSLPNSPDITATLGELKTVLYSVHPTALRDVVPNISFNVVFECLSTDNNNQIETCCAVLERLLDAMDGTALLHHFHGELLQGLAHPSPPVQLLCIRQVQRANDSSIQQVARYTHIINQLVCLVGCDNLPVANAACKVLISFGSSPEGLSVLFENPVFGELKVVSEKSDVVRFRVYQMIISIARTSPDALLTISSSGLLQRLVNEVHKNDILVQLNGLELLTDLALCQHGLEYLDHQGVTSVFENMLANRESDPMINLVLPGLVKFFGNIAYVHPKEVFEKSKDFVKVVFELLSSDDQTLKVLAIETICLVGSTPHGKLALEKLGQQVDSACETMGQMMKGSTSELKKRVLISLASLLSLQVQDQTAELLMLTERWYSKLCPQPLPLILKIVEQPFTDVGSGGFAILVSMAMQSWGQQKLNSHPGFNEYLIDRSTETTKEGKEGKYEIIKTLVESPTVVEVFGTPYFVKLKEYYSQGPFYVRAQAEVAVERDA